MLIYSRFSRCSTARSPDPRYNLAGPAKVGAHKNFLFNESSLEIKIAWVILWTYFILYQVDSMLYPVVKCHNQLQKWLYFSINIKGVLVKYEKYGTLPNFVCKKNKQLNVQT